eukprot:9485792-Pyramimonas_sp.AAC.1
MVAPGAVSEMHLAAGQTVERFSVDSGLSMAPDGGRRDRRGCRGASARPRPCRNFAVEGEGPGLRPSGAAAAGA